MAETIEASPATCSRTWSNVSLIKLDSVSSYPSATDENMMIRWNYKKIWLRDGDLPETVMWGTRFWTTFSKGSTQSFWRIASASSLTSSDRRSALSPAWAAGSMFRFTRGMSWSYLVKTAMTGTVRQETSIQVYLLRWLHRHVLVPSFPEVFSFRNSSTPVSNIRPPARGISKHNLALYYQRDYPL